MLRSSPRTPSKLSASSERLLGSYTLAASAAGVSLLALAQSAQAKIVYTPAYIKIKSGFGVFTPLDLNNDGIVDFNFEKYYTHYSSSFLGLHSGSNRTSTNAPVTGPRDRHQPAALPFGVRIGSSKQFGTGFDWPMAYRPGGGQGGTKFYGRWANGGAGFQHRYLGLKFAINGETHFGWARVKIVISNNLIHAYITGYAYETVANQPIAAGQTKGTYGIARSVKPSAGLNASNPQPTTLGALALGSPGLSIWRREESVAEGN